MEHDPRTVAEGRRRFLSAGQLDMFRNLLFTRIMPNLSRVGLLTDAVKPQYEELGLLQFAALPSDADINWTALEAPMPTLRPQPMNSQIQGLSPRDESQAAKAS